MEISDEDLESRQKLKAVKDQIDAPAITGAKSIHCPYCSTWNTDGDLLCCETLRKAVITILMGRRQGVIEEATKYVN